jgi:predicted nucleotidyltransferase
LVNDSIAIIVRKYLNALRQQDIPVSYGVIFGSQVRGDAGQWSDIDLLVISPRFDENLNRADINLLWRVAANTDSRIEPIPVGQRQFLTDDSSAMIEIARREGQIIPLAV